MSCSERWGARPRLQQGVQSITCGNPGATTTHSLRPRELGLEGLGSLSSLVPGLVDELAAAGEVQVSVAGLSP